MKMVKKGTSLLLVIILVLIMSVPVFALGTTTSMINMHELTSSDVETRDEITDSYGKHYSGNILAMDVRKNGYIKYDLKGKYDSFTGTLVCSTDTSSNADMSLSIFADGKEVYSITGFTRQQDAQSIDIDLTGVNVVEFMSAETKDEWDSWFFIADGIFTSAASPANTYLDWNILDDVVVVDSSNYSSSECAHTDAYGVVRHDSYEFDARRSAYAMFNLNKEYETFTGYFVPQIGANDSTNISVEIFADNKSVFSKKGIKKTSEEIPFTISVKNVKTLKVETSTAEDVWDQSVFLVHSMLSKHQHKAGEPVVTKDATCTEDGMQTVNCTECGSVISEDRIPATGHSSDGTWVTSASATCGEEGEQVQHCTVCNEICETQKIDRLPHTPSDGWTIEIEPTCDTEGTQVKKCTVCGDVAEEESIPTVDHSYGKWATISGSVWNNPIVKERTCSICGDVEHVESNSTSWLKPLVIVLFVIIFGGLAVIIVTLKMNGLALEPASIKKLFSKESLTDDDIDDILNKPDDNSDNQ